MSSILTLLLSSAVQQIFFHLEHFEGKACVEGLDKSNSPKALQLNLELLGAIVSHDSHCFQSIC